MEGVVDEGRRWRGGERRKNRMRFWRGKEKEKVRERGVLKGEESKKREKIKEGRERGGRGMGKGVLPALDKLCKSLSTPSRFYSSWKTICLARINKMERQRGVTAVSIGSFWERGKCVAFACASCFRCSRFFFFKFALDIFCFSVCVFVCLFFSLYIYI